MKHKIGKKIDMIDLAGYQEHVIVEGADYASPLDIDDEVRKCRFVFLGERELRYPEDFFEDTSVGNLIRGGNWEGNKENLPEKTENRVLVYELESLDEDTKYQFGDSITLYVPEFWM